MVVVVTVDFRGFISVHSIIVVVVVGIAAGVTNEIVCISAR